MSSSVEKLLARAVMDLMISIELTDDDDIDPDVATAITEPVGYLLNETPAEVREHLIGLFRDVAQEEQLPARRALAAEFPEALGLIGPT
jgi:hypothetical protein